MEKYKVLIDGKITDADDRENLLIDMANAFYHAKDTLEVIGLPREDGEMPSYIGYARARVDQCPYAFERELYGYRVRYHFLSHAAKEAASEGRVIWIVDGTPQVGWPSLPQLKYRMDPWVSDRINTLEFVTSEAPDDYIAWVSAPNAYHQYVTRYDGLVTYEYKVISREAVAVLRNILNSK